MLSADCRIDASRLGHRAHDVRGRLAALERRVKDLEHQNGVFKRFALANFNACGEQKLTADAFGPVFRQAINAEAAKAREDAAEARAEASAAQAEACAARAEASHLRAQLEQAAADLARIRAQRNEFFQHHEQARAELAAVTKHVQAIRDDIKETIVLTGETSIFPASMPTLMEMEAEVASDALLARVARIKNHPHSRTWPFHPDIWAFGSNLCSCCQRAKMGDDLDV